MSPGTIIGVASLFITIGLAFIAGIWRLATVATRLETTTKASADNMTKLETRLTALDQIPVLSTRVGTIETAVSRMASMFPKVYSRLDVLETKSSSFQRFRAVREGSRPDPEETNR